MGRAGYIPKGRRIYAAFARMERKKKYIAEARAAKRREILESRLEKKKGRPVTQADIARVQACPTKLGLKLLKESAVSSKTKPGARVFAAQVILEISGHVRGPSKRRNKGDGS